MGVTSLDFRQAPVRGRDAEYFQLAGLGKDPSFDRAHKAVVDISSLVQSVAHLDKVICHYPEAPVQLYALLPDLTSAPRAGILLPAVINAPAYGHERSWRCDDHAAVQRLIEQVGPLSVCCSQQVLAGDIAYGEVDGVLHFSRVVAPGKLANMLSNCLRVGGESRLAFWHGRRSDRAPEIIERELGVDYQAAAFWQVQYDVGACAVGGDYLGVVVDVLYHASALKKVF